MDCLFISLIVSLEAQKALSLMKSNLSIFPFVACAFIVIAKKHCLAQGHKDLCFSVKGFIDLPLTCSFMIHSELFLHMT